jgi:hypothetical protein
VGCFIVKRIAGGFKKPQRSSFKKEKNRLLGCSSFLLIDLY